MIRIQRYSITILIIVALTLGTVVVALSEGDTYPVPPEGWWKSLKGGETAVFEMKMSPNNMKMVTTIEKVDGSNITFSSENFIGEMVLPKKIHTIDAASNAINPIAFGGKLPPYATVKKLEDTIFEAGGQRFNCTIYEIEAQGVKMKAWHSPQLPPIFMGGRVKTVTEWGEARTVEITLKSYKGGFL